MEIVGVAVTVLICGAFYSPMWPLIYCCFVEMKEFQHKRLAIWLANIVFDCVLMKAAWLSEQDCIV